MTIPKNLDGCRAKLTAFRAALAEQIAAGEGIRSELSPGLATAWDKVQGLSTLVLHGYSSSELLTMYEQGIADVSSRLVGEWDINPDTVHRVAVLNGLTVALAARIDAGRQSDQIETRESELEDERPDFDESSDFDFLTQVPRGNTAAVN